MFGASENRYLGTNDRLGQGQNPGVGGREHSYWEALRLHEFRIWLYSKKSSSSAQRMEDGAGAGKAGWGWGPVCYFVSHFCKIIMFFARPFYTQ